MILSGKNICNQEILLPHEPKTQIFGMSYGESLSGYDIRIRDWTLMEKGDFQLGITVERFFMPKNVLGVVHDKSSWARRGLSVFNTVIEPGWCGYLTLELVYHGDKLLWINPEAPIAQVIFHYIDEPTGGYDGKYQNAKQTPQEAILD